MTDLSFNYMVISDAWIKSRNIVFDLLDPDIQNFSCWLLLIGIMLITFEAITKHIARGAVELVTRSHKIANILKYAFLTSMLIISFYLCFSAFTHYQNGSEIWITSFQLIPIFLYFILVSFILASFLLLLLLTKLIGHENYVVSLGAICTFLAIYRYIDNHYEFIGGITSLIVFTLIFALWSYGRIHNLD
jgi:hypothetical protein